jgi:hypothetical protein
MSIVGDGVEAVTVVAAQVDAGAKIPLGKQAVHPPFMIPTQV